MGNCPDCGGSGGNHYNDCSYDGTGGGYSGGPRRGKRFCCNSERMRKLGFTICI